MNYWPAYESIDTPKMDPSPGTTTGQGEQVDPRLSQANKLFQTGVMLIFGARKSVDKAIKCIQKAITLNDTDYKYWQLLGEAYYQRGSLNPAINCFIKSVSLAERRNTTIGDEEEKIRIQADCTYSRLRMSDIRLSVSHLDEAISGYSDIIKNDPNNVAALIGLSKAELQLSRNCFSSNLVQTGHSHCMKALKYALLATKLKPDLCLTWKLGSDCCIIQFVYGQRGKFQTKLDIQFPGSDDDGLLIDRSTCIDLAQQFLSKALAIKSFGNSGCLWHNLGLSLYLKSTLIRDSQSDERDLLLKRSLKCLIKALDCDRTNSQIRNSIGIVAYQLNYLNTAQNFFIRSIQSNLSTSEIQFSNLGYIYLQKGEFRLAGVAFNRCQAEEPLYSRSWLGNALINEANNIENLSLLRHCYKLENNYESQIMYATKVTTLSHSAEYSKDVVNALECMRNLINFDLKSLEVVNTLGLLYEQCNHVEQARKLFDNALDISPQESRAIFNRLRQHCACNDCVVLDAGQSSKINLDFITKAEKLANSGNNREYMLNYLYYLFNNRDYKSFNPLMTKFMEKLPQDDVKCKIGAQILLALKAKAEGEDFKSWLFKNIIDSEYQCCIESVINLYTLLLLGTISDDTQLVEQISGDLTKYLLGYLSTKNMPYPKLFYSIDGFWTQLAILSSIFCFKDTSKMIRPLVVLFPDVAEHWLYYGLALMLEETYKQQAQCQRAIYCLKKAKLIESTNANLSVVCDILLAILVLETKKTQVSDSRVAYLCRARFKCPDYDLLWRILAERNKDLSPRKVARYEDCKSKKKLGNLINNLNEQDMSLFHLAIDQAIKMVVSMR